MSQYHKSAEAVAKLTPEQFRVTQESATERPGTGEYLDNKEPGIYVDIVSGEPLFASSDKFESGCGWPSFTKPIEPAHVKELRDSTHGMTAPKCVRPMATAISGMCSTTVRAIAAVCVWRDTPFFDERQRAALSWAEAVTLVAQSHVPDDAWDTARRQFSDVELVDLSLLVIAINGWNRLAISFGKHPS